MVRPRESLAICAWMVKGGEIGGSLEAASSSTRGSGWAPSGLASRLGGGLASQNCQASPEEARSRPRWHCQGGTLTMLLRVAGVEEAALGGGLWCHGTW